MEDTFENRVKKMPDNELVSTYQYVSGLFARFEERLDPETNKVALDLNFLKHEILDRLTRKNNSI